ncbi:KGK domain-containing protein [Egbenema bharatensis]|uniref:KGK domain-containing protein n=1 Tax=Egbenema bharatensis TaxID=3463334 RepID=UPI003A8838A9
MPTQPKYLGEIQMSDRFYSLESDAVISVNDLKWNLISHPTFTINEMMQSIKKQIGIWKGEEEKWATEGVECKVLRPNGKGWQTGKVRIQVEFRPDEIPDENHQSNGSTNELEFPLDEVRQTLVGEE